MTPCLLLLLALAATPHASVLNAPDNVWDAAVEDMNGDAFREVFVLTCDEKSRPLRKAVCAYVADASGAYPSSPTFTLLLPASIGSLFFAEVDGVAPRELIALDGGGAAIFRFTGTALEPAGNSAFPSLLPTGSKEPLFLKDGALDLDGDKIDEWLIPVPTGFELRHAGGAVAPIPGDVISEVRRANDLFIIHHLPAYYAFTLDGQTTKSLACCSDEYADFSHGPGWKEHSRFKIPLNVEEKWDASSKMADINNDGFPDLAVTQTRGTIHLEAVSHLYIASAPFIYPEKPTATFATKGGISTPELVDIDGDKRLDVLLISVPLGLKNFINFFLRGKLSVDAQVYLFNGAGFGEAPAFETTLTMDAPEGREQVAYAMGDFNGDGRQDIAFGQSADQIGVFVGEPGRFISSKPWASLNLPAFGLARTVVLNEKPAKDLLVLHPSGKNAKRVDVIVF